MRRRFTAVAITIALVGGLLGGVLAAGAPDAAAATSGWIKNNNGFCLGIQGSSQAAGAKAAQGNCEGTPTQTWHATSLVVHMNGYSYNQFMNGVGWCLGVTGGSNSAGAVLDQGPCSTTSDHSQFWASINTGGYSPVLVNGHSGLVIGVQGGSTKGGALVVQGPPTGDPSQIWIIDFSLPA
jgi:arabinoxylan arabinofuranohydrolase